MKLLKHISIIFLVVLLGIQLIPAKKNQTTEVSSASFINSYKVPADVIQIMSTSCYNCHSNNTNYPWYSQVQPIGWLLENHINKGKAELNFSEFGSYSLRRQKNKLKAIISQVENNEMPIASYTFIHRDARLSNKDKKFMIDYFKSLKESLE